MLTGTGRRSNMRTNLRTVLGLFGIVALISTACRSAPPAIPTVPGPETPRLLQAVHGYVITSESGVVARSVPELKEGALSLPMPRKTGKQWWAVYSVSGPDQRGRVAFIDNNM